MAIDDDVRRVAQLEADNLRLRRLLAERDAPAELRHRLQNTLAMLRTIIRKSAETNRDLNSYVGHIEDRLAALVRTQTAADTRGSVELHSLLADELFHYGAKEGERAILSGPPISLHSRAGQIVALAIHELAVNAVEHGVLGADEGRVDVVWSVMEDESGIILSFNWRETGQAQPKGGAHRGFGTEVLTRTLPYELKATTMQEIGIDGLRWTIEFPLTERVGFVGELVAND